MAARFLAQQVFSPFLLPLSWVYGVIMRWRAILYAKNIMPSYKSCTLTFCVGNISWGGTGKSPVTEYILQKAKEKGVVCTVLSRGYGFHSTEYPVLLHARNYHDAPFPDEALMLIKSHPETQILIDPNRVRAVKYLENETDIVTRPHCIIMDDGFQHLSLKRDYDLMLLDKDDFYPQKTFGILSEKTNNWGRLLPLGSWREPASALSRASIFMVKCCPSEWEKLRPYALARLEKYKKPLFVFHMQPVNISPIFPEMNSPFMAHENYALLLGVANPIQVEKDVTEYLGIPPQKHLYYGDHHIFTNSVDEIVETLQEMPIICTVKDAVKLEKIPAFMKTPHPIYKLQSQMIFYDDDDQSFDHWIDEHLNTFECMMTDL